MSRYILTGAPGAGKTSILRALALRGHAVVDEAATDAIVRQQALGHDEVWQLPGFLDLIIALQRERQEDSISSGHPIQFYDRSPICTLALARFLGLPVTDALSEEVSRITAEGSYERRVFFVRPIGFCLPTAARRISFEDSLVFERVHEETYLEQGFEPVDVPPGEIEDRADAIEAHVASWR